MPCALQHRGDIDEHQRVEKVGQGEHVKGWEGQGRRVGLFRLPLQRQLLAKTVNGKSYMYLPFPSFESRQTACTYS